MTPLTTAVIITLIAGVVGTGAGGAICALSGRHDRSAGVLMAFAAGVMTGISACELIPDALMQGGVTATCAGIALGGLCVFFFSPHKEKADNGSRMLAAGRAAALSISLHNVPEGMIIGASCVAGGEMKDAFLLAAVIGLHNIPEGMAIAAPLISGKTGRLKAALLCALCGLPTTAGAVAGYLLGTLSGYMTAVLQAFAAGAMLFVSFSDLLPCSLKEGNAASFASLAGIICAVIAVSM